MLWSEEDRDRLRGFLESATGVRLLEYLQTAQPVPSGPSEHPQFDLGFSAGYADVLKSVNFLTTDQLFQNKREEEAATRSTIDAALRELDMPASEAEKNAL